MASVSYQAEGDRTHPKKKSVGDPDCSARCNEVDSADCADSCQRFRIKKKIRAIPCSDLRIGWPTRALAGLPASAGQPR